MQHNPRHVDRRLDRDHPAMLRLEPALLPPPDAKVVGPFPANICATCGATVEVVAERTRR